MAAISLLVTTSDTGTTPNTSGSYTPTSGRLQVVVVSARTTTDSAPTLTNSAGLTFTRVSSATVSFPVTAANYMAFFVADALTTVTSSQSVTASFAADQAAGSIISVFEISGMTRFGTNAIRQVAVDNAKGLNDTLTPTFASSVLTGNPTLVAAFNSDNPAGLTPPTSWTELVDNGHATPTSGQECCNRDSGFTGTSVPYGSVLATNGAAFAIEFDTSAAGSPIAVKASYYRMMNR